MAVVVAWDVSIAQGLSMLMAPEQPFPGKETAFAAEKSTCMRMHRRSDHIFQPVWQELDKTNCT